MSSKLASDRKRKRIERLENELLEERQNNFALTKENKMLISRLESSEKTVENLERSFEEIRSKYERAEKEFQDAKRQYGVLVSEMNHLKIEYEKQVSTLIASISRHK